MLRCLRYRAVAREFENALLGRTWGLVSSRKRCSLGHHLLGWGSMEAEGATPARHFFFPKNRAKKFTFECPDLVSLIHEARSRAQEATYFRLFFLYLQERGRAEKRSFSSF